MTTSVESKPERTGLSTQDLPTISTIPTIQEMKTWDEEKLLLWIQKRNPKILKGGHLEQFKEVGIDGDAFLISSFEFFHTGCGLPPVLSLKLKTLVDEVRETGKSIL
jgi:hypothetical protein